MAQHELGRVRTQVDLSGEVGHLVAPEVVREETRRDAEAKRRVSLGDHAAVSVRLAGRQPWSCVARVAMPASMPRKTSAWSGKTPYQ